MNEIDETGNSREPPIPIQRARLEIGNKIYPIYDGINTIGRNPNAVVNIKNINVSQHHAVIVVIDDGKQYLSDIKSFNGTFLNYNKLQAFGLHQLNDNDLIKFGDLIATYKRNEVSLDVPQNTLSQAMSQSFYAANTQDIEIVNDFHEVDIQMFDNNPDTDFHDLPTQVQHFDTAQTVEDNIENSTDTKSDKSDATNQELELLCANSTAGNQDISQNIDDNDTSNDSLVFAEEQLSKLEEQAFRETGDDGIIQECAHIQSTDLDQQTEQIIPVILVSRKKKHCIDSDDDTDIEDNQIEGQDNDDSIQKITEDKEQQTQQIKQETHSDVVNENMENITGNNDESSNESLDLVTMQKVTHNKSDTDFEFTQQVKPVILANTSRKISDDDDDDETDIDDNVDGKNESTLMNESDIIPATQNVDFVENQTIQITDIIEDSFENSSCAHQDEDVLNQSTQLLQFNMTETYRNHNKIDEIYGQATQQLEKDPETSTEDVNGSKSKDTSSDIDLFALPETPKFQKRSKSNITQQSLISNVENELQDMFATQQEKFTCSQLANILSDSPTRPMLNKNTTNKTCHAQINLFARPEPIITDEKVEQELETLFQSQSDLTCSQLVQILDDSKEVTNPTIVNTTDSTTKTLKRKLSKMTSDKEIEISESGHIDTNQNKKSAKRSRSRCVKSDTDPQSSLATTSIEENPIDNTEIHQENVTDESESTISPVISSRKGPMNAKTGQLSPSQNSSKEDGVVDKSIDNLERHPDLSPIKCTNSRSARNIQNNENTRELRKRSVNSKKESQSDKNSINESGFVDKSEDNLSVTNSENEIYVGKIDNNKSSVKEDIRKSKKRSVNSKEDSQSSIESTSSGKPVESDLCKNRRSTRRLIKCSVDSKSNSQSSVQSTSSEDFFDVFKTTNHKKLKDSTSQEAESSESSTGSERNLRSISRKRATINEDDTNKSTKIRLNEKIATNTQLSVSIDSSSLELKETSATTIRENNKMSRRTRKNPNNITIPLLPVKVTVPRKEENCENEQKPSKVPRDRPRKKNTESISTVPDTLSSTSTSSTINRKTTNIRKGKRRLSANSRSMMNLEKNEEQNDIENYSETKNVRKRRNQQQDETVIDKNNESLSTPERGRRKLKPKVVFTMLDSPELESVIRQLGGTIVGSVDACTVLVTEHVKRSCKLLSAVGQAKPICSPQWLFDSKGASHFLDPWNYILKDNEAEEKWNFKLHESLERSSQKKLMENYTFQLFVNQAVDVLKGAIEACGGKCVTRYSPKNYNANFVIIASPDNRSKYNKIIKQHPAIRVVTPEAIFDGTLRQELQFEKHLLL